MRDKLTALFRSLTQAVYTFKPGDIVGWKPGMQNKKSTGPFVVTVVLDAPVLVGDPDKAGSPYFRENLDIKLASLDEDGDFLEYHYDSRRLQPVK